MPLPYVWRDEPSAENAVAPGAIILSSFPSAGLATTIAAHYIIRALGLPRIGVFESSDAPAIAIVQQGHVHPSIRVYGRPDLAIVMSEFPPTPAQVRPIAEAIMDGAARLRARFILAIEGVVPPPPSDGEPAPPSTDQQVWSVVADEQNPLLELLRRAGTRPLMEGIISGISGALLVQGQQRKMAVGGLLVSASEASVFPDHRAGAALIETLDRLLPDLKIDTKPLRTQAEIIERSLRAAMKSRRPEEPGTVPGPSADVQTIYQ
jgi:predicted ATP-grasp superfamily ATP-dependent carboligase